MKYSIKNTPVRLRYLILISTHLLNVWGGISRLMVLFTKDS